LSTVAYIASFLLGMGLGWILCHLKFSGLESDIAHLEDVIEELEEKLLKLPKEKSHGVQSQAKKTDAN